MHHRDISPQSDSKSSLNHHYGEGQSLIILYMTHPPPSLLASTLCPSSITLSLLSGHSILPYCVFLFLILLLDYTKDVMYKPHVFCFQRLVVKPDQLIKRRGKLGLIGVNLDLQGVKEWLKPRLMKETMVSSHACTECSVTSSERLFSKQKTSQCVTFVINYHQ